MHLTDSTFIETELFSETSHLVNFLLRWDFPLSILTCLLMEIKVIMQQKLATSQFIKTVKTAGGQCIPVVNGIMNC